MSDALTEVGQFVRDRFTMDDSLRHPDDPVRKSEPPCCVEHKPGWICILPIGHS